MQHTNLTNTQAERRQKSLARGLLLMTVVGAMAIPLIPAVGAQAPAGEIVITHDANGWTYNAPGLTCPTVSMAQNPSVTCRVDCDVVTVETVGGVPAMVGTSTCGTAFATTPFPGTPGAPGHDDGTGSGTSLTCTVTNEPPNAPDYRLVCGAAGNVPTLSQWGIVGMIAAMGGIGVLAISRRRK